MLSGKERIYCSHQSYFNNARRMCFIITVQQSVIEGLEQLGLVELLSDMMLNLISKIQFLILSSTGKAF